MKIIQKHEDGTCVSDLANLYRCSASIICTLLKIETKKLDVAKGVNIITKHHPKALEDVEKLLLVWMNERGSYEVILFLEILHVQRQGHCTWILSEKYQEHLKMIMHLREAKDGLKNLKRTGIHSIVRHGEAASSDKAALFQRCFEVTKNTNLSLREF